MQFGLDTSMKRKVVPKCSDRPKEKKNCDLCEKAEKFDHWDRITALVHAKINRVRPQYYNPRETGQIQRFFINIKSFFSRVHAALFILKILKTDQ